MKKEKAVLIFFRYYGKPIRAKREIPYEMTLTARLLLDEICFRYNKSRIEADLNKAIDEQDEAEFKKHSDAYKEFIWK